MNAAEALGLARRGALSLVDLLTVAEAVKAAGDSAGAIGLYRAWLAPATGQSPPLAQVALFNLGVSLGAVRDHAGAETAYRDALRLQPEFVEAQVNLGTQVEAQGRRAEAISVWRALLASGAADRPDRRHLLRHLLNNLGRALEIEREFEEAEAMLERSLRLAPDQPDVIQHWLHLRQRQCRWPVVAPFADVTRAALVRAMSPLAMLAAFDDPALQLYRATTFLQQKFPLPAAIPPAPAPASGSPVAAAATRAGSPRRLRLGYLSGDFNQHALSLVTVEVFERHDASRVELTAFSWSRDDGSPTRARVRRAMHHYVPIGGLDDAQAAEVIRARGIDVLIDLQGLTAGARPGILSRRPAPIQITWLGFPGPTAMPYVDYVIADRYVLPEAETPFFIERPLYLANCFHPSDTRRPVGPTPSRAEVGLPEDGFVFCSFNGNYKFTEAVFGLWMRIIAGVPGSVLWLLADNRWAQANLAAAASRSGVDPARIRFAPRIAPDRYLARFRAADLFLDTYPFNGGVTASDVLWAGLPLLTRPGRTFPSRMAGSLLTSLGLPDLIARDDEDYVAKAIAIGRDPASGEALKRRLADARGTSPVFRMDDFTRDLEDRLCALVAGTAATPSGT